jgi:hypothetical protein
VSCRSPGCIITIPVTDSILLDRPLIPGVARAPDSPKYPNGARIEPGFGPDNPLYSAIHLEDPHGTGGSGKISEIHVGIRRRISGTLAQKGHSLRSGLASPNPASDRPSICV